MNQTNLKTVLLVEDNEDNLIVYRTILDHVVAFRRDAYQWQQASDFAYDANDNMVARRDPRSASSADNT